MRGHRKDFGFYSLLAVKPMKDEDRKFLQISNSSSSYRS